MSNEAVGVVLAGIAVFFGLLGYLLSRAGLDRVEKATASVGRSKAALGDQLDSVNEALESLTGRQAPARVAWSLCVLCLVAAFIAFGLIEVTLAPGD